MAAQEVTPKVMTAGEAVCTENCAHCHRATGQGEGRRGAGACVMASQARQENFSRTCAITFHWRGISSSVSVTSSPILRSLSSPQHGQTGTSSPNSTLLPRVRWPTVRVRLADLGVDIPPSPSPKEAIPYTSEAMRHDLQRVRDAWADCQSNRSRDAIYGYLSAVYGLVAWWTAEGQEVARARRALRLQRLAVSDREDPFAAVIRCTADPAKADKRTRSKWSRVMRYVAAYKPDSEPLGEFIRRKGGINECVARFSRCLGDEPLYILRSGAR